MIYLNNAATSFPKPERVNKAVIEYLGSAPFHCLRTGHIGKEDDTIDSCRRKIAQFFNISGPENIIFTSGATESLNLVIRGLDLSGGHVVTTCIEHNSVLRPLKKLEKKGQIELSIVGCDKSGHVCPKDISDAIRKNTRAVIVNHCSNVTGHITDIDALSEICHKKNILFIVDASQSAGCVPIDVGRTEIDILVFTGHKSLYGLPGTGGLYLRPGIAVEPLKVGGTGIKSELEYQPEDVPLLYEAGTPNVPGIVSMRAGVDFILKTGMDKINDKKQAHINRIINAFKKEPSIEIYGGTSSEEDVSILCFNISGVPSEKAGDIFENSFGIVLRSGLHCAPLAHKALGTYPDGALRVSPSFFTADEEIEKFIYAALEILRANISS